MHTPVCVRSIAQREHTRQLHFTVESSGSNILAEWTSNLPNDLRAVKDTAANSNCKKYIGFRRGMAFGRLCFKMMLGESKIEGCSSQTEIITLRGQVQSWRCEEKIKVSSSVHQICSTSCREIQLQVGLGHILGQGCDHAIFLPPSSFSCLRSSTVQGGRRRLPDHPRHLSPEPQLVDAPSALILFELAPPVILASLKVWDIFC